MNDQTNNIPALIPEVGLTEIDGEPRARDIDIGERLGFSRPRDVRALIEANIVELEGFGTLARQRAAPDGAVRRPILRRKDGKERSEPTEYWLSEEQVLLIASLSKAPNAPAVRAMLIRVFVAWRRGHLETAAVPADALELIRRTDGISRMLSHKVTEMEKVLATAMQAVATIASVVQPPTPILVRRGETAGQIWVRHGFVRIKITSWFGNRLAEAGCLMEGKADIGNRTIRLFDPDKADIWLKNGGRLLVQQKLLERTNKGQGVIPFPVAKKRDERQPPATL